ncbi:MAG: precorrin-2 C(20)-methyltransferase [Verrucomicrobiae bacterium]|nr:precorrin-2 C(20)-methyltransferase [Verrucomicrobiae bacterium]
MKPASRKKNGRFFGIGVGPGDPRLLTLRGAEILRQSEVVFHVAGARTDESVSGRVVDAVDGCRARRVELVFTMAPDQRDRQAAWRRNARLVAAELRQGRDCAFVTIGDPLLYSTYIYLVRELRRLIPRIRVETVPGISAFQAAAAKAHLPLVENREVLTIIPAWAEDNLDHPAIQNADTLVFLKTYRHRNQLLSKLRQHGFSKTLYAARVGLPDEKIVHSPARIRRLADEYLSLLIVKKRRKINRRPPLGAPK